VDKDWRGSMHSYALALHPGSLRLLDEYGAADELIRRGHRIDHVAFYDGDARVAALDLATLGGPFPHVTVVPQSALEDALAERLRRSKVEVWWNHEVQSTREESDAIVTRVARREKYSTGYPIARTEWMVSKETDVRSAFLIGADGYGSFVRMACGSSFEQRGEAHTFAVFEFLAAVEFAHEARVVFHDGTTNVLWPLGEGRARWSFEVPAHDPPAPNLDSLKRLIAERAPWFREEIDAIHWTAAVVFQPCLVDRFARGRVWLAGDAAHSTGPVGVQSMNVGLREAHDVAERISAAVKTGFDPRALERYDAERQHEWRELLGLDGPPRSGGTVPAWAGGRLDRLLPCIPASGPELRGLLSEIGVQFA